MLSLSGDYQDSLKAETMLAAAFANNTASPEGQDLLIDLLNRRGDPASRERVITLLRQIQTQRGLTPQLELQLGRALFDLGDWDACLKHMTEAINRYPDDAGLRVGIVEMLIDHKEFGSVDRWMSRLAGIEDAAKAIPQLRIRLAAAKGDMPEVRTLLEGMTPNLLALTPEQLQIVHAVAVLADSVGDHEYALRLIAEFSARVPGNDLELARYTGMYGDLDAGIDMLDKLFPSNMDQVLSMAVEVLRARREDDPAKVDEFVNRLIRAARRDDPEAARRMVLEAEALEVQEKFDEAIAAYEQLLARDDVPKFVRATALNNLAFLLAMNKRDLERALDGVNEAMEIIGPISDILDTRALVYYHSGKFKEAVKDLTLAVKINSTASKYFHLTMALLAVGDNAAALEAWDQAEIKGISADAVPDVELEDFEQTKQKIEALGAGAPL
jgi:tetratricopeptide (TPR) repeat protein